MSSCPDNQAEDRPGGAEHFSRLIGKVIDALSGKERLGEEEIEKAWRKAAGVPAARQSRPVSLKKSVLVVNVASSSWLYELTTKKKEIIGMLETELKGKKVREIRFRIGDIKETK
ncbi:MAG: DUF721 domain-containing protein [Candidatus Omnitrophota bacterium]